MKYPLSFFELILVHRLSRLSLAYHCVPTVCTVFYEKQQDIIRHEKEKFIRCIQWFIRWKPIKAYVKCVLSKRQYMHIIYLFHGTDTLSYMLWIGFRVAFSDCNSFDVLVAFFIYKILIGTLYDLYISLGKYMP